MRKFLFPLLAALGAICLQPASAQPAATLTGRLADAGTGNPVAYATVALLRDSTVVSAAAAGADGRFAAKAPRPGDYTLSVTMVGYAPHSEAVAIPEGGKHIGTIVLTQGVAVDDVVVTIQKPLVMHDAEKQTYSVEDDPQASSSTLEEIIRKVPQLSLDGDGNVLLNGQSNYKILLDGHTATTLSKNFTEIIRTMPASQIVRIEVITNPSTKYEAEGAGGIINLITRKQEQLHGYNGSVTFATTPIEARTYSGGANLSLQTGKFAAGIMAYAGAYDSDRTPTEQSAWQENFASENRYTSNSGTTSHDSKWFNAGIDMSYQPDTLNLITLNGWIWTGRSNSKGRSEHLIENAQHEELLRFMENALEQWRFTGGSAALNYEHNFGRQGHTLTLSDEVEIDPDTGINRQLFEGGYDYTSLQEEDNRVVSNTVQLDYANRLNAHHDLEAGLKHIYRHNRTSKSAAEQQQDEAEDGMQVTDMIYRQHILALYAGYGFTSATWSGRAGARMECTWNDADVNDTQSGPYSFANRQFNVVPYASVTFVPAAAHTLSLSYTQRLQRPALDMLSPAVHTASPLEISYGNPQLEAAVYHTLNLQYGHYATKWSILLGLNALLSNNNMSAYTFSDTEGVTNTTYSNDVHTRSYGFSGSFAYRPSEKFNLSLSCGGNYGRYDYDAMDIHTDRFSFNENLSLDFALWKEGRLLLGENYNTGNSTLGSSSRHRFGYYTGLKQQFLKKRLDVSIMLNNPFGKFTEYRSTQDTPTFRGWSCVKHADRNLRLRIVWRFGKQEVGVKRTSRSISNDDIEGGGPKSGGK